MHRFKVTFRALIRPFPVLLLELPGGALLGLIDATSNDAA
jgi:hypothetical protein